MKKSEHKEILIKILIDNIDKTKDEIANIIIEVQNQLNFLPPARQVPIKIKTYPEHTYEPEMLRVIK